MLRTYSLSAVFVCVATSLGAQSFNVDIGSNTSFPTPASTYAAAGSSGFWNGVAGPAASVALQRADAQPSAVTLSSSGGFLNVDFDHPGTNGDDGSLLDDLFDLGGPGGSSTWTFQGLENGAYVVRTYAWGSDNPSFTTRVAVAGSSDPNQDIGGPWTGTHQQGVTFARHALVVSNAQIVITLTSQFGFGSLNGIQLEREVPVVAFCFGDGQGTPCPCGNDAAPGSGTGCLSSLGVGALLGATGSASVSADTLVLQGSAMPNASALYFQGTLPVGGGQGTLFGDGLRCAGGAVLRLGTQTNVLGASHYPEVGDDPISIRGAVVPGAVHTYQVWYRNAASFCTAAAFNLTNGVQAVWGP